MATHSIIGIRNGNMVRYVEMHYDGYPREVMPVLTKKYTNEEAVNQLISRGRILELESCLTEEEFLNGPWKCKGGVAPEIGKPSYFKELLPFRYSADDKQLDTKEVSLDEFLNHLPNHDDYEAAYYYLFDEKTWKIY